MYKVEFWIVSHEKLGIFLYGISYMIEKSQMTHRYRIEVQLPRTNYEVKKIEKIDK